MRTKAVWFLASTMVLLGGAAIALRAEISPADQQTLKSQYAGKVLMFRKSYRMINKLEVNTDGTVEGDHKPGYWAVDGTVQVKTMEFHKDRITFKCAKLWADIKNDGGLHYFPASAALKGKIGYPAEAEIAFRTNGKDDSLEQLRQRINRIFFGDQESKLSGTPPAIVAYIQKATVEIDIDPISGLGFSGTPPKVVSRPAPEVTREAALVGQVGKESFVVYVDPEGKGSVVSFTLLLQYGLEEAAIDAVKNWKFEPAMKDGKPVGIRIPMDIDYKKPLGQ